MLRQLCIGLIVGIAVAFASVAVAAQSRPEGQLTIAFDTSIAPTYLDPAETPRLQTPFGFCMPCTTR